MGRKKNQVRVIIDSLLNDNPNINFKEAYEKISLVLGNVDKYKVRSLFHCVKHIMIKNYPRITLEEAMRFMEVHFKCNESLAYDFIDRMEEAIYVCGKYDELKNCLYMLDKTHQALNLVNKMEYMMTRMINDKRR